AEVIMIVPVLRICLYRFLEILDRFVPLFVFRRLGPGLRKRKCIRLWIGERDGRQKREREESGGSEISVEDFHNRICPPSWNRKRKNFGLSYGGGKGEYMCKV